MYQGITLTCFLIGLSKIKGALSLVKVVTRGSLFAKTNSAIADFSNLPSAEKGKHHKTQVPWHICSFGFIHHKEQIKITEKA